jgi:hypothetical protein
MAFLGETFSTDSLPVSDRSYDLIPEGWYNATITKAELNNTKAGTGQKIDIRYDITGPTQQGRVVFGTVNVRNQSQKAEEIGRQQLGEIMRAIGLAKVQDTDQLIGGNLGIKLVVKTGEYAGNEIKGYRALGGVTPAAVAPFKPVGPSAMPAAKSAPPWAKK